MTQRLRTTAAVAAATITLMVWGAFSHLVLIRGVGFSALPNERAVVDAVAQASITPGLYAFPAPPEWHSSSTQRETPAAFEARFRAGPSGLLIVRPFGEAPVSGEKMLIQLFANVVAACFAVFIARGTRGGWLRRAASVTVSGVLGLATIGVITWNWYAFTTAFFAALALDVIGGWTLVGVAVARIVPGLPNFETTR